VLYILVLRILNCAGMSVLNINNNYEFEPEKATITSSKQHSPLYLFELLFIPNNPRPDIKLTWPHIWL